MVSVTNSPTGRIVVTDDILDRFHRLGAKPGKTHGEPPAKKLAMLLRPAFVADTGRTYVWGDWSAIEARTLPWLANDPEADKLLDVFRENDADPSKPDIYVIVGSAIVGRDPLEIWAAFRDEDHPEHEYAKTVRQAYGKVPTLSLGFGGGLGALQAMAVNYGVYVDDVNGLAQVKAWRETNRWAKRFWGGHNRDESYGLWGAANSAYQNPDTIYEAGRVAFVFDRSYLNGTLFMFLPCGRPLAYPRLKWEWREVKDKKTGKVEDKYQMTFQKGYSRSALWYGKFAENCTQGAAASILRRTLRRLDMHEPLLPLVGHTHDEIVAEPWEKDIDYAKERLTFHMTQNGPWDRGLPLAAEITASWYYSKAVH